MSDLTKKQSDLKKKHKPIIPAEAHERAQHQDLLERDARAELAKKNQNFVQVKKGNLKEIRRLIDQSAVAAKLLFLIAEKMNKQNALMVSFNTLAEITGLSRSTLSLAVKLLKKEQWLQVIKVGTANAYIINSSVFWQDSADKKFRHGQFAATIIASQNEQDDTKESLENTTLRHFPFLISNGEIKEITDQETGEINPILPEDEQE